MNDLTASGQAIFFLLAAAYSGCSAFIYDLIRVKRRIFATGNVILTVEDLVFWILSAIIGFLLFSNVFRGDFRFYLVLGCMCGLVFYSALLSKYIIISFLFIANIAIKAIKKTFELIILPFRGKEKRK